MTKFAGLGWICVVLSATAIGCAAEDQRPEPWKGTTQASSAGAEDDTEEPAPPTPACSELAQRDCVITIEQANGVRSCWKGVQFCDEGSWSECYSLDELPPSPN